MYLSPGERDYSSYFGLLFVKDLQYFNIYYVQTYLSNILIEKVVLIDENILKNCLRQESDSSAHQLLFILFFYMPWYFLQYTLNNIWRKLQRAHKKIIRERERKQVLMSECFQMHYLKRQEIFCTISAPFCEIFLWNETLIS